MEKSGKDKFKDASLFGCKITHRHTQSQTHKHTYTHKNTSQACTAGSS